MDFRTPCKALILALSITIPFGAQAGAVYAERADVQAFAHQLAVERSLDENAILTSLAGARHIPSVLKAILPPATPAQRSWVRYRSRYLDHVRIDGGVKFWQANAATLARAETDYGVPAEIIVSIIGVETIYGRMTGNYETLSALATLAFDYPPRAELFRRELGELFVLASESGRRVDLYRGSYAGAIGLPQFLPSSIRHYAVDFDGNGKIELDSSAEDAIGSVANFLRQHGWQPGQAITVPARVSDIQKAVGAVGAGLEPQFDREALERLGIAADSPGAPDQTAAVIALESQEAATEYWLGYRNFHAITRYNQSSFYAMSVVQLAQAITDRKSKTR